jgi:hypothetical protein
VGRLPKGASYRVTGKQRGFLRLELEPGHPVFVAEADATLGGSAGASPTQVRPIWQVTPPVLTVSAPPSVTGSTVRLKGLATDDAQVKDLFVRVFNRDAKLPPKKVFYLPNAGKADKTKLAFETDVPLWPGSNIIQVFARETNEVQSVSTLVVLQRGGPRLVQAGASGATDRDVKALPAEFPGKPHVGGAAVVK